MASAVVSEGQTRSPLFYSAGDERQGSKKKVAVGFFRAGKLGGEEKSA
jgi:hypothetical protein